MNMFRLISSQPTSNQPKNKKKTRNRETQNLRVREWPAKPNYKYLFFVAFRLIVVVNSIHKLLDEKRRGITISLSAN